MSTLLPRPSSLKRILRLCVAIPTRNAPSTVTETMPPVDWCGKNVPHVDASHVDGEGTRPGVTGPLATRDPAADRSLVVLDPDIASTTLRATLEHPEVNDGDLHLLVVFPTAEYEARRRARLEANVTAPYTIDHLEAEARRIAQQAGRAWLDPAGVAFEPMGAVGRLRDCVQTAVEDRGPTHVFVASTQRTFWQRLLGVEDRSAMLAEVLPAVVTVVPVDGALDPAANVVDGGAIADPAVDPGASTGK